MADFDAKGSTQRSVRRIPVLLVAGALALFLGGPLEGADSTGSAGKGTGGETVRMEAFTVRDAPVGCFGLNLQFRWDNETRLVTDVTVLTVLPGSSAEKDGIGPLTSIRKINGKPVQEFTASLKKGSELNKLLMNRAPGDHITLEIQEIGSSRPRVVTLTEIRAGPPKARQYNAVFPGL